MDRGATGYTDRMGETNDDDRQDVIDRMRRADTPSETADAFWHARRWLLEHPDDEAVHTEVQRLFARADAPSVIR
jgi:hypothetical protein